MRVYIVLSALMACCGMAHADVYKWKDDQGRVQFGDRPPSGSTSEKMPIRSNSEAEETTTANDPLPTDGVVMYSTTRCGACMQARAYMIAKGISFTEHDVEKSEAGRAAYKKLNGRSVPIILVGGQRMNEFSASTLEQLIGQMRASSNESATPAEEAVSSPNGDTSP